jgi:hypothetical protein
VIRLVVLAAVCATWAGCTKDVCEGISGTCVTIHVVGVGVASVDQLAVDLSGDLTDGPKRTPPTTPQERPLPVDVAATLPKAFSGSVTVHVVGYERGVVVGEGRSKPTAVSGHVRIEVPLTGAGGGDLGPSPFDMKGSDLPPPVTASLRFGHFASDLPPFDLCLASSAQGLASGTPFLSAHSLQPLAYPMMPSTMPSMSDYVTVPVADAAASVRLVAANATDCKTPLPNTHDYSLAGVPSPESKHLTAVVLGNVSRSYLLAVFVDDQQPDPNGVQTRFINAWPASVLDFYEYTFGAPTPTLRAPGISYATTGYNATPSYVSTSKNVNIYSVRYQGFTTDLHNGQYLSGNTTQAGWVVNVFAIDEPGTNPDLPQFFACVDQGVVAGQAVPYCSLLPFAH